ncbi:MAG: VanZ family protein [Deltaproteobacteria bacterium]|nr:VanZ family protein [Deltaproteobacteria bacterium]
MIFKKRRYLYILLALLYASLIFYFSSRPALSVSHDKMAHIFEYSLFGFIICPVLRYFFKIQHVGKLILFAVFVVTLYGVTDEFHQSFVPGRESSIYDVIADFVGSFLGALIYVLSHRLQRQATSVR